MGELYEGMPLPRLPEQGHRPVTILNVGAMDRQLQRPTIGINHGVTLSPLDLDQVPFHAGKTVLIAKRCAAMVCAGGRIPHNGFQGRCRNLSEACRNSIVH